MRRILIALLCILSGIASAQEPTKIRVKVFPGAQKLNDSINQALQNAGMRERLDAFAFEPVGACAVFQIKRVFGCWPK